MNNKIFKSEFYHLLIIYYIINIGISFEIFVDANDCCNIIWRWNVQNLLEYRILLLRIGYHFLEEGKQMTRPLSSSLTCNKRIPAANSCQFSSESEYEYPHIFHSLEHHTKYFLLFINFTLSLVICISSTNELRFRA